ncbi:MAG: MBL fold metallo-hydrolase [Phycisphaerales bacterium]|nr:MBL fold metallo-hydrolase [Phycisphaerales bacterium]
MDAKSACAISILASGSAANCAVVRLTGSRKYLLIDAGLSPRATRTRMIELGLDPAAIGAVLFTHFDRDHIHRGWIRELAARPIPVLVRAGLEARARAAEIPGRLLRTVARTSRLGNIATLRAWETPHDWDGSTAWRIDTPSGSIGFATDLGHVTDEVIEGFRGVDVLAIEANYDQEMQVRSSRPEYLKERIMGGKGHLSNEQSIRAIAAISRDKVPSTVLLLHLSQECNCPELLTQQVRAELPTMHRRVRVVARNTTCGPIAIGTAESVSCSLLEESPFEVGDSPLFPPAPNTNPLAEPLTPSSCLIES